MRQGEAEIHALQYLVRQSQVAYIKSVFHHLTRANPKQLCALAHPVTTYFQTQRLQVSPYVTLGVLQRPHQGIACVKISLKS